MFIKNNAFKRLLKAAWTGSGLTVGRNGRFYFLQGAYWILFIDRGSFRNKDKAAVIELIGNMPEEAEVFTAYKSGDNQYEIPNREEWDARIWLGELPRIYKDTTISLPVRNVECSMIQDCDTFEKSYIASNINEMVDIKEIDRDIEGLPEGPIGKPGGSFIIWRNETSILVTFKVEPPEDSEADLVRKMLRECEL